MSSFPHKKKCDSGMPSKATIFIWKIVNRALLFAPEMDRYLGIVKNVFWRGIASRGGKVEWRSPQQRYEEGGPLINAMIDKWRLFQEQGADYVNKTRP